MVGLAVALCVGLLAYHLFTLFALSSQTEQVKTERDVFSGAQLQALGVEQLVVVNLFGELKKDTEAAPQPEVIPETRLKLILQGAFSSSEDAVSSALIATDANSRAQRYFIGEEVPGNAVLEEVHATHVVLKRGGRLEKLLFPRERDSTVGVAMEPSVEEGRRTHTRTQPRVETEGNLKNRLQELRRQLNQNEENVRL